MDIENNVGGEFKPHTPDYIKEMEPTVLSEHMKELGAKGGEASGQARLVASEATRKRDEEITAKLAAIKTEKGITELDDKIAWMSEAIRVIQSYGLAERASNLDKILVAMVDTKTKVQLMLENQVTTDTIWAGIAEILKDSIQDEQIRQQLLTKVHGYLSSLIEEALRTKGVK